MSKGEVRDNRNREDQPQVITQETTTSENDSSDDDSASTVLSGLTSLASRSTVTWEENIKHNERTKEQVEQEKEANKIEHLNGI